MDKARRRRVPAFGEWNYYYYHYSGGDELSSTPAAVCGYAPDPEACSDVWFRYSPPLRKPLPTPKKTRRPEKPRGGGGKRTPARASDGAAAPCTPAKAAAATCRVVRRPVDADLYQVPPPDFAPDEKRRRPRKKAGRSLWMGCLGLNCVA